MIPFNIPPYLGVEEKYLEDVIKRKNFSGNGFYTKKCEELLENRLEAKKVLLTTSCTHALEISALLIDMKEGDEIIMPSYTFVSTASAFVLRGAKIVFVDIHSDNMNIDETKIEQAITNKTKAIVPVHYAGIACEMDTIMKIANKHNLYVIEDAAQAMNSNYKGKALGTIGHFGTFSFHETKNYTSAGEGGALIINAEDFFLRSEIIREKGTNRSQFFRGMIDKYSWVDLGSSYLMNELSAAYLYGQLINSEKINIDRKNSWNYYFENLKILENIKLLELNHSTNNGHIFYIKLKNSQERRELISFLKKFEIQTAFHFVPLHSSKAGLKFGVFNGKDSNTTKESERLLRLPLFYGMEKKQLDCIILKVKEFFKKG